ESRPMTTVDPVVMATSTEMLLQTVVSREVAAGDAAVVTVGSLRAGTKENIIPDEAELQINVRSFDTRVRERVLEAITRIVKAEAAASGAEREPEITPFNAFPLLYNDEAAMARTEAALRAELGDAAVVDPGPVSGSEDFGRFGTAATAPHLLLAVRRRRPRGLPHRLRGRHPRPRRPLQPLPVLRPGRRTHSEHRGARADRGRPGLARPEGPVAPVLQAPPGTAGAPVPSSGRGGSG